MKRFHLLVFLVVLSGLSYLLYARTHQVSDPIQPGHLALIVDDSTSQPPDCSGMPALLTAMPKGMAVGRKSTVSVFTLGSEKTSFEPVLQLPPTSFHSGSSNFGNHGLEQKVQAACMRFGVVRSSSIYRAVRVALDHLTSLGCGSAATAACRLWIRSDMDETVSKAQLSRAKSAASLTNTGIEIVVCGYAVTSGAGKPRGERSDALNAVWRSRFSDTSIVRFMPFCPGQAPQAVSR